MKNWTITLIGIVFFSLTVDVASAQTPKLRIDYATLATSAMQQTAALPDRFGKDPLDDKACLMALATHQFRYYEAKEVPRAIADKRSTPLDGKAHVLVPLDGDQCVFSLTNDQIYEWIIGKDKAAMRAERIGSQLVIYAFDVCGNGAKKFSKPPVEIARNGENGKDGEIGPRGPAGIDGKDGRDGHDAIVVKNDDHFCSSKKCKGALIAIGTGLAGGLIWDLSRPVTVTATATANVTIK